MTRTELSREIYGKSHLTGTFVLRSGATASEYFDKYLFESDPDLLRAISEHLVALVPSGTEILAGLELGGIPLATMLGQVSGLPVYFVRKKRKEIRYLPAGRGWRSGGTTTPRGGGRCDLGRPDRAVPHERVDGQVAGGQLAT